VRPKCTSERRISTRYRVRHMTYGTPPGMGDPERQASSIDIYNTESEKAQRRIVG